MELEVFEEESHIRSRIKCRVEHFSDQIKSTIKKKTVRTPHHSTANNYDLFRFNLANLFKSIDVITLVFYYENTKKT